MKPALTILSLGWGVQSWTLAAMSALDVLPKVVAVHSDTTWESESTYRFAEIWTPWLKQKGVDVVTVGDPDQAAAVETAKTDIPAFTISPDGDGQLRRQCTHRWKIIPIRRYVSGELRRRALKKTPGIVQQWLGISTDEWTRAKDADVKYIQHRYPLLEMNMSRGDCQRWLAEHGLPAPPKSACTFCPYHSRRAWEEMKRVGGHDWEVAVEIDLKIRDTRPPYPLFVHPARLPLDEAVTIPEDFGYEQTSMFDIQDAACDSGYCWS